MAPKAIKKRKQNQDKKDDVIGDKWNDAGANKEHIRGVMAYQRRDDFQPTEHQKEYLKTINGRTVHGDWVNPLCLGCGKPHGAIQMTWEGTVSTNPHPPDGQMIIQVKWNHGTFTDVEGYTIPDFKERCRIIMPKLGPLPAPPNSLQITQDNNNPPPQTQGKKSTASTISATQSTKNKKM